MELLLVITIAISLSMDAFSLALAYGTFGIQKKQILILAILVGIFHFFMPLIGMNIGELVLVNLKINPDFIVFVVFLIIGIQMIIETFKEEEIKPLKVTGFFLFAFAVSIDSFVIGLTLTRIYAFYLISALFFALFSCFFTFVGLSLGNKIRKSTGKISTILGGLFLIIIGIIHLIKCQVFV